MIFHLYDMTVMNTSLIFLGLPYFGFLYETYDLHDDASTRFFSYFKVNKKHLYAGVKDGRIIHRRQNGGEGMLVANRNTIKAFKMAVEFSAPPPLFFRFASDVNIVLSIFTFTLQNVDNHYYPFNMKFIINYKNKTSIFRF